MRRSIGGARINDGNNGKRPVYQAGERCEECGAKLATLNSRTTCFNCQNKGFDGEIRKPVEKKIDGRFIVPVLGGRRW